MSSVRKLDNLTWNRPLIVGSPKHDYCNKVVLAFEHVKLIHSLSRECLEANVIPTGYSESELNMAPITNCRFKSALL